MSSEALRICACFSAKASCFACSSLAVRFSRSRAAAWRSVVFSSKRSFVSASWSCRDASFSVSRRLLEERSPLCHSSITWSASTVSRTLSGSRSREASRSVSAAIFLSCRASSVSAFSEAFFRACSIRLSCCQSSSLLVVSRRAASFSRFSVVCCIASRMRAAILSSSEESHADSAKCSVRLRTR